MSAYGRTTQKEKKQAFAHGRTAKDSKTMYSSMGEHIVLLSL